MVLGPWILPDVRSITQISKHIQSDGPHREVSPPRDCAWDTSVRRTVLLVVPSYLSNGQVFDFLQKIIRKVR